MDEGLGHTAGQSQRLGLSGRSPIPHHAFILLIHGVFRRPNSFCFNVIGLSAGFHSRRGVEQDPFPRAHSGEDGNLLAGKRLSQANGAQL